MIEPGTILQDRFVIDEQIGVGGMGAVYRAVDQKFGTYVAIKETFYKDPDLAEAFEREARLLNGLHHPLFPHVSDHFIEGNGHFLVMEYIEGEDLSAVLKRGERFPLDTALKWTLDLLDGLDYLHSQDPPIIHRDVKPSNLKLTPRGNLVLLDFGMAKETSDDTRGMQSVFGYSRRYSPLEQIEGTGTDARSDIFSLGATVFHLLTGTPPVDSLARASAIVAGRPDPVKLASDVNRNIPELVAVILNSALDLNPDKRFVSARAMSSALELALQDPAAAASHPAFVAPLTERMIEASPDKFPALEAFEAESNSPLASEPAAEERIEVPVVTEAEAERKVEKMLEPVDVDQRARGIGPAIPVLAVTSNSRRPYPFAIGVALLVLLCGVIGYAILRLASSEGGGQSVPTTTVDSPSDAEADRAVTEQSLADDEGPRENEASTLEKPYSPVSAHVPELNAEEQLIDQKRTRSEASLPRQSAQNGSTLNKSSEVSRDRNGNQSLSGTTSTPNTRRTTRPRIFRADSAEPPVSSIESVLTGIPDRARQQQQWDIWREAELRRQRRLRRQMRRGLPY